MKEIMAALLTHPTPVIRPAGVRLIAVACFLLALYFLVSAALVNVGAVSFASTRYLLGEYAIMGPLLYLILAVVLSSLGLALDKGWSPARRLAIVAAGFLLATSLLPISAAMAYFQIVPLAIHGAKVIVAVMAIRYLLLGEVVEWFSARSGR